MEWSSFDIENETELSMEDVDSNGQHSAVPVANKVKNARRAIEIISEQQQLRELLQDYYD